MATRKKLHNIKLIRKTHAWTVQALLLSLTISIPAYAIDFGAQVGVTYSTSDNVNLQTAGNEQSDHLRQLLANVRLDHDSPLYFLDLDYSLLGIDYKNDFQQDNNTVSGRGLVTWVPLPRRFEWEAMHLRTENTADNRLVPNNNNDETRNVFSTGPNLILGLGTVDDLVIKPRYTDIDFERSVQSNSQRVGGSIEWVRELSGLSQFALRVGHEEADYDSNVEQTFSVLVAEYTANLRQANYQVRLGYGEAETLTGEDVSGPIGRISANFVINGSPLLILYERLFTDTSLGSIETTLLSDTRYALGSGGAQNFNQIDVLLTDNAFIGYSFLNVCSRCELVLSAGMNKQDYEIQAIDQDVLNFNAGLNYAFTQNFRAGVAVQVLERDFLNTAPQRKDDELTYGVNFAYSWLRNLQIGFNVGQQERDSNIPGNDYEELRFSLNVIWGYNFGTNSNSNSNSN